MVGQLLQKYNLITLLLYDFVLISNYNDNNNVDLSSCLFVLMLLIVNLTVK